MAETEANVAPEAPPSASAGGSSASSVTPRAAEPLLARRPGRLYLAIPLIAAAELLGQLVISSRVASRDAWREALAFVRSEWRPDDTIVAAPRWSDPLLREAAGSLLDARREGASDLAAYARLWVVSIRGAHAEGVDAEARELTRDFGRVRVERFALPAPSVLYDFVEHVGDAHVTRTERGVALPCREVMSAGSTQGGLGNGPFESAPRHLCDPARPWLAVFRTTTMDLELRARRCVSQHAQGEEPITTSYDDVPLGSSIVLYGGLWWERERWRNGGDVEVIVRLDGDEIGRMTHHDGDGWKRMEAAIPDARRGARGRVSIEVSARDPEFRAFCWAGSTRGAR